MEKVYLLVAGATAALFLFWAMTLLFKPKDSGICPACDALGIVTLIWTLLFLKDCVLLLLEKPVLWGQIGSALDFIAVPITSIYLFGLCRPQWVIRRCVKALLPYLIPCIALFVLMVSSKTHSYLWFALILGFSAMYSLLMLVFLLHSIRTYHLYLKENYSYEEEINMRWLIYVSFLFFLNCVLYFVSYVAPWWNIVYYVSIIFIWWILYRHTIRQRYVPVELEPDSIPLPEEALASAGNVDQDIVELPDYVGVRRNVLEEVGARIDKVMQEESLYLDAELSLVALASRVGTNKTYVYQYLKYCKKVSFLDYINGLRIEKKAVPMLEEDKSYTINEIAYASGFQSTATFRRAFARKCGCAPSQYKAKVAGSERKA